MSDEIKGAGESLHRAHERLDSHDNRIRTLELNEAGANQWRTHMAEKMDGLLSGQRWLSRLIVGALAMAIVAFIVNGGLNVAQ
ncbi:MAG: hemolysin XhlA family protein [Pseudoruegeria sp.]